MSWLHKQSQISKTKCWCSIWHVCLLDGATCKDTTCQCMAGYKSFNTTDCTHCKQNISNVHIFSTYSLLAIRLMKFHRVDHMTCTQMSREKCAHQMSAMRHRVPLVRVSQASSNAPRAWSGIRGKLMPTWSMACVCPWKVSIEPWPWPYSFTLKTELELKINVKICSLKCFLRCISNGPVFRLTSYKQEH